MISVSEALAIIATHRPQMIEVITPLADSLGAVAARDITAQMTLPPRDVSAMDGYAAGHSDAKTKGAALIVIGESAAGNPFGGPIKAGECVRIFTGAIVPQGADTIIIQENVTRDADFITCTQDQAAPRHIRKAGQDFSAGDILVKAGAPIGPSEIALIAAGNHAAVPTRRRPIVAILANGDELKAPGSVLAEGQIVSSNSAALAALITQWGGEPLLLGIAADSEAAILEKIALAKTADIIVPVGGASVGDHDHMRAAFTSAGLEMHFAKIAVKPGKPTWFGALGAQCVLGLPGNPASAIVCAHLFLKPLMGRDNIEGRAKLTAPISKNGPRETYQRARLSIGDDCSLIVTPFPRQDSALITPLTLSNALIKVPPHDGPWQIGDSIEVVSLGIGPHIL
ncbi:MAG: gephyrin-like molybdotransferase Glp [Robiginitomaculum sp.]